jgi:hypothetical protein
VLDPGRGRTKIGQLWDYARDDRHWRGTRSARVDRSLDAFMGVGNHRLDVAQPAPRELAQEAGPERLGLGGTDIQRRISRRPLPLTPTATITATETIRRSGEL